MLIKEIEGQNQSHSISSLQKDGGSGVAVNIDEPCAMGQPQEWEDDYRTFAEGCGGSFLRAIGNYDTCLEGEGEIGSHSMGLLMRWAAL